MKTFTNEEYIVTLFELGFERIDDLLYTHTLTELYLDKELGGNFRIVATNPSQLFDLYVERKNGGYVLKEGRTIDTNISPVKGAYVPLIRILKQKNRLKPYLSKIDFKKVVKSKIETLERAGYGDYSSFLCPKEEAIRQSMLNEKLYDQESNDIAKAKGTIKK